MIDAQPFLGELVADPSARGLFAALSLLGTGVEQGQADLDPYLPALRGLPPGDGGRARRPSASAVLGGCSAASWPSWAGDTNSCWRSPSSTYGSSSRGARRRDAIRHAARELEFVKSGDARVRIPATWRWPTRSSRPWPRARWTGMIGSVVLITLWLFLAVRMLAADRADPDDPGARADADPAVRRRRGGDPEPGLGRLRHPVCRHRGGLRHPVLASAIARCASDVRRSGARDDARPAGASAAQILVAAAATAAGFLAFVPTDFRGVAELGLIAGVGMLIAFLCTMTFLPAAISLFRPRGRAGRGRVRLGGAAGRM